MASKILDQELKQYRISLGEIIKDLHQLTIDIGNEEMAATLSDLRERIHEPFMFVIVGEVKAGKSSFINALLGEGEVCKVAPDPCTDTIQQVVYGDERQEFEINPYLKRIELPVDILKEIAIVDTPGTNTISEHHQEITERFIPASDLIVFVFEAKNPYRQSAWSFFDFIHTDWRKKIIFVLQQKDLMKGNDLEININGVKKYAVKKGIGDPTVFAVSALYEMHKLHEDSGFKDVRAYIREHITGGNAIVLKLKSNIATAHNINERIEEGIEIRDKQLHEDREFRKEVVIALEEQQNRSNSQVDLLVENLLIEYDRITANIERDLATGLRFGPLFRKSVMSVFGSGQSAQDWLSAIINRLEVELTAHFKDKLHEGVDDIAYSIRQMAKIIDLKIKNSQKVVREKSEIFGDIADRRAVVLKDLKENFSQFLNQTENFVDTEIFPEASSFGANIAAGSGIAVIGMILAGVVQGMVFDITGGILSTLGILFAGVTVWVKRNRILEGFRREIAKGRSQLQGEIDEKLKAYIDNIRKRIDRNFEEFDLLLENEEKALTALKGRYNSIEERLGDISQKLA